MNDTIPSPKWKDVSEEEFNEFIKNYPRELEEHKVCFATPFIMTYNDLEKACYPYSIVAEYWMNKEFGFGKNEYAIVENYEEIFEKAKGEKEKRDKEQREREEQRKKEIEREKRQRRSKYHYFNCRDDMPSVERNANDRSNDMKKARKVIKTILDNLEYLEEALEMADGYSDLEKENEMLRSERNRLKRSKFIKSFMLLDENDNYVRDIREADKITGYDKEVPEEYDVM